MCYFWYSISFFFVVLFGYKNILYVLHGKAKYGSLSIQMTIKITVLIYVFV